MSSTALSNYFSASFICHPYNCSLLRVRSLSSAWYYSSFSHWIWEHYDCMFPACQPHWTALQHWWVSSFPWHSPLHPLLLSLGLGSRYVSMHHVLRSLGKYSDVQIDGKGEETELCLRYLSPARGISNSFFRSVRMASILCSQMHILPYWIFPSLTEPAFHDHSLSQQQNLSALTELFLSSAL